MTELKICILEYSLVCNNLLHFSILGVVRDISVIIFHLFDIYVLSAISLN